MIIGILSDTHNRVDIMAAAMRLLREHGAQFYIHCGDVGEPRILDHLAGLAAAFVWGNTDWDRLLLQSYAEKLGIQCLGAGGELTLDSKLIAVLHGDDGKAVQRILAAQRCNYLLQGHTHVRDDRLVGRVRLINPGALHRASVKTVAVLDTQTDQVRFLPVQED